VDDGDDDWVEVAYGQPAAAEEAFRRCLADMGIDQSSLAADVVRIDVGRLRGGGDFRRYWIRRSALAD
jgi:hypothetical protein